MAEGFYNQNKGSSAILAVMLLILTNLGLIGITIGDHYFNITPNMNLTQLIGRSDLGNSSDWFNATTSRQQVQPMHSIVQLPGDDELSGSQGSGLPAFLQETPGSQAAQLPAFLQ